MNTKAMAPSIANPDKANDSVKTFSLHQQRFTLVKPYLGRLALGFVIMLITVGIQLTFPSALAYFIDHSVSEQGSAWLTMIGLLMLVAFVIQAAATALRFYLFETTGTMIVTGLRQRLYGAIIRQEIGFFDSNNVGDLSNRLSADVEVMQDTLTMGLAIALRSLFTCIGGLILLLSLSPSLSLLMLMIVPVFMLSSRWVGRQVGEKSKLVQENLANCNQIAQENLHNIRLVHAFNQQQSSQQKYQQATDKAQQFSIVNAGFFAGFQGINTFIQSLVLLITLWFGGQMVVNEQLTIGGLTSFILYAGMVATSASAVSWFWGDWMQSIGATERVFELLNRIPQSEQLAPSIDGQQQTAGASLKGQISFDNVSFAYPTRTEQLAIKHFNLTIKPGEKIAFVGHSGAGKSTIANLLLGFYQPTAGTLSFDHIAADDLPIADIRRNIAIVEQQPTLFSGTIMDNLRYAVADQVLSDEAIFTAAKDANADEFIRHFPDGYQTLLGERGVQLSGGQKQRIAIARALLRDAKILILDEATSALDAESEFQVQSALERLMRGRTTLMIAHRLSTIIKAQRIVVMVDGQINQMGRHDALIADHSGRYYQLIKNQLSHL